MAQPPVRVAARQSPSSSKITALYSMFNVSLPIGSPMTLLQAQLGYFSYCLTNIEADLSVGSTVMT